MFRFCCFITFFLLAFTTYIHCDETLHVTYNTDGKLFTINGYDLYNDKDFLIRTGDLYSIENIETMELPGDSYCYIVTLVSADKNICKSFQSRVSARQNKAVIVKAQEYSRTTTDPKWVKGTYHPEVCYGLTLEDGSQYTLTCWYSDYATDEEAQAVLSTMIVEPGDTVTFFTSHHIYWDGPHSYENAAEVNHEGKIHSYRLRGLIRSPQTPPKKPNTFKVSRVEYRYFFGLRIDYVAFHDFFPNTLLRVSGGLSIEEIARIGELEFVRRQTHGSQDYYVFRDPISSKEVTIYYWEF